MKLSKAIIKGYSHPQIQGRQNKRAYYAYANKRVTDFFGSEVKSCCVIGAAAIGMQVSVFNVDESAVFERFGCFAADLNDGGMKWEDIVGILQAEGL